MTLLESKTVDFSHIDDRGSLYQLVHGGYEQINVLTTRAGVHRGGHYHKQSVECFFVVSGSVEVTAWLGDERETRLYRTGDFFQINPPAVHSMSFPEDCVMVAMYDRCVELPDGSKDIFPG